MGRIYGGAGDQISVIDGTDSRGIAAAGQLASALIAGTESPETRQPTAATDPGPLGGEFECLEFPDRSDPRFEFEACVWLDQSSVGLISQVSSPDRLDADLTQPTAALKLRAALENP